MSRQDFAVEAMELALKVVGHPFPRLSALGASTAGVSARPHRLRLRAPEVAIHSFFLTDVTYTTTGKIRLLEANSSNAALSSSGYGQDDDRSRHMAAAFQARGRFDSPLVALLSFQDGFIHVGEFMLRARAFARHLQAGGLSVALRPWDDPPGPEQVTIMCGPISAVARQIGREGPHLTFAGRRVGFAANSNIIPELIRLGIVSPRDSAYDFDDTVFHEGPCTPLAHDKGTQQTLAAGTGIAPLQWRLARDPEEWLSAARWFRERGLVAVAKMNSGSGGCGIEVVTPQMSDAACLMILDRILDAARTKYGAAADATVYPIRLFEFAHARPYRLADRPHLWDLRVQCLVSPGQVEVRPCVVRLAPEPFDGRYTWDSVVSNLTGRDANRAKDFMRLPDDVGENGAGTVLAGLGMDRRAMRRVLRACGRWSEAAALWGQRRITERPPN